MTRSVEERKALKRAQDRMYRAGASLRGASPMIRALGPDWEGMANDLITLAEKIEILIGSSHERGKRL